MDVDFFKNVNDKYGHPVGDKVLIQITDIISSSIRKYDIFSRYGGEEFAVMCKNTNINQIRIIASYLKDTIQKHKFKVAEDEYITLTVSIGISVFNENYTSFSNMIHLADNALYKAKKTGRNKDIINTDYNLL